MIGRQNIWQVYYIFYNITHTSSLKTNLRHHAKLENWPQQDVGGCASEPRAYDPGARGAPGKRNI